jgi:hypothetical protein
LTSHRQPPRSTNLTTEYSTPLYFMRLVNQSCEAHLRFG